MTVKHHITLLFVLINLIACRDQLKSRRPTKRLTKLVNLNDTDDYPFHHNKCENLPPNQLSDVLGAAFNSRYMSIEEPTYWEDDAYNDPRNSLSTKRNSAFDQPFYVDDTFALEISDKPAWEVKHTVEVHDRNVRSIYSTDPDMDLHRSKRDARRGTINMQIERPWECSAKIKWIDLGSDYFPRFLRSVECTKKRCWYNHYVCKPRSFTVKLLRRRNGECVQPSARLNRLTNDDMPGDLKELWVWEERAVNFCCDCAVP